MSENGPDGGRRRWLQAAGALAASGAWPTGAVEQRADGLKVLRLAFAAPESTFDPPQTNTDLYSSTLIAQILEAPLAYDYLARPVRLLPQTAAAMPEVSPDGRRFTVRIRPGIFFADDPAFRGRRRELVAADYVYAIKRFYDPRYNSSDLYLYASLALPGLDAIRERAVRTREPFDYDTPVDGVRTLDRYTFQVQLGKDDPRFIYRFADPVTMGAVAREVVEFYGDEIGAHPVGTGAFRLKRWRRASRIELERSPDFRGAVYDGQPADDPLARQIAEQLRGQPLPRVDAVEVDIIEEAQPRWLSFLNGQLDLLTVPGPYVNVAAPGGELAPYLAQRGLRLQRSVLPAMGMSFFYMDHPLVGGYAPEKVALRRAIGLAHDGDAYIRLVFGGQGVPAQSTIPPFTSGYEPDYKSEMSTHDPARAKALLDLYGYRDVDGDGWREQPDGQPLRLRMATLGDQRSRVANDLWRRNLSEVGLHIEFETATWPELLKRTRAGSLMMWGYSWSAGSPDGGFFLGIAYGPNAAESNDPRFSLPAFDRLFEQQQRLADGPERVAVMRQAKNLLVAYMPYKVHIHPVSTELVQPWTSNYCRHPFMRDVWRFIDISRTESGHRSNLS